MTAPPAPVVLLGATASGKSALALEAVLALQAAEATGSTRTTGREATVRADVTGSTQSIGREATGCTDAVGSTQASGSTEATGGTHVTGSTRAAAGTPRAENGETLWSVEIVVVDSMQVYRGMDIGTAKPTERERAAVPHHGIDLVEPTDDFTVSDYRRAYDAAVEDLRARGRRPLLVAGTGLYLRSVVDGLNPPGRWPEVRAELESEPRTELLHARLAQLDPVAAGRMEATNRRRVVRALEVCLGSGRTFSSFGPGLTVYPRSDTVQIGLRWPREVLARRVEDRFLGMMNAGLLDEVRDLLAVHGHLSRTAGQALGYKELAAHLQGELTLDEAVELAVRRTRRYAIRQLRWFQRDPRVRWVEMGSDDAMAVLVAALSR